MSSTTSNKQIPNRKNVSHTVSITISGDKSTTNSKITLKEKSNNTTTKQSLQKNNIKSIANKPQKAKNEVNNDSNNENNRDNNSIKSKTTMTKQNQQLEEDKLSQNNNTDDEAKNAIEEAKELMKKLDEIKERRESQNANSSNYITGKHTFLTNYFETIAGFEESIHSEKEESKEDKSISTELTDEISETKESNELSIDEAMIENNIKHEQITTEEEIELKSIENQMENLEEKTKSIKEELELIEKNEAILQKMDKEKQSLEDDINEYFKSDPSIKELYDYYLQGNDTVMQYDENSLDAAINAMKKQHEEFSNNYTNKRTFGDLLKESIKKENIDTENEKEERKIDPKLFSLLNSGIRYNNEIDKSLQSEEEGNSYSLDEEKEESKAFLTNDEKTIDQRNKEEIERKQQLIEEKKKEKEKYDELINKKFEKYGYDAEYKKKENEINSKIVEINSLLDNNLPISVTTIDSLETKSEKKRKYNPDTGKDEIITIDKYVYELKKPTMSKYTDSLWNKYLNDEENNIKEITVTINNVSDKQYKDYIREQRRDKEIQKAINGIDNIIKDLHKQDLKHIEKIDDNLFSNFESEFFMSEANKAIINKLKNNNNNILKNEKEGERQENSNLSLSEEKEETINIDNYKSEIYTAMDKEDKTKLDNLINQISKDIDNFGEDGLKNYDSYINYNKKKEEKDLESEKLIIKDDNKSNENSLHSYQENSIVENTINIQNNKKSEIVINKNEKENQLPKVISFNKKKDEIDTGLTILATKLLKKDICSEVNNYTEEDLVAQLNEIMSSSSSSENENEDNNKTKEKKAILKEKIINQPSIEPPKLFNAFKAREDKYKIVSEIRSKAGLSVPNKIFNNELNNNDIIGDINNIKDEEFKKCVNDLKDIETEMQPLNYKYVTKIDEKIIRNNAIEQSKKRDNNSNNNNSSQKSLNCQPKMPITSYKKPQASSVIDNQSLIKAITPEKTNYRSPITSQLSARKIESSDKRMRQPLSKQTNRPVSGHSVPSQLPKITGM